MVPRLLAPAPPPRPPPQDNDGPRPPTCFFDLPAELRVEIYKLIVENVVIHILPLNATKRHCHHPLVRTSRQVRLEVLPIIHSSCEIRANVTDFIFDGLLAWMGRIPPNEHANLCKNLNLSISLCTTSEPISYGQSLRKWLQLRADRCRPQPAWQYNGPQPVSKIANDLRRRAKRMPEQGKREEMRTMLEAIGIMGA